MKPNSIAPLPAPRWIEDLRLAAREAIKPEDIRRMIERQVALAREGNTGAVRFVLDYILGGSLRGVTLVQQNLIVSPEAAPTASAAPTAPKPAPKALPESDVAAEPEPEGEDDDEDEHEDDEDGEPGDGRSAKDQFPRAWQLGFRAGHRGSEERNPYGLDQAGEREAWIDGHRKGSAVRKQVTASAAPRSAGLRR